MNAYCVKSTPSAPAMRSTNQLSCSMAKPYQAPPIATVIVANTAA